MADLETVKEIIKIVTISGNCPLCIVGGAGIGKTEMTQSFETEYGVPVTNIRVAQAPPEDILGIPRTTGEGKFVYEMPWWWPTEPAPEVELDIRGLGTIKTRMGLIHFDEVNRAKGDRHQAIFQLLDSRKLGPRKLPEGWQVMSSINPATGDYQVHELEKAMRGRFLFVAAEFSVPVWLSWASTQGDSIPPFVKRLVAEHSIGAEQVDISEYPDFEARTLTRLANITARIGAEHPLLRIIANGLIGPDKAAIFMQYASNDKDRPKSYKEWQAMSKDEVIALAKQYLAEGRVDIANGTLTNVMGGIQEDEKKGTKKEEIVAEASKLMHFLLSFNLDLVSSKLIELASVPVIRASIFKSQQLKDKWSEIFATVVETA